MIRRNGDDLIEFETWVPRAVGQPENLMRPTQNLDGSLIGIEKVIFGYGLTLWGAD